MARKSGYWHTLFNAVDNPIPLTPVAITTDKRLAEAALHRLGISDYFEFVITVDEVGRSKESPDIFMEVPAVWTAVRVNAWF